jgi:hypothetical protein
VTVSRRNRSSEAFTDGAAQQALGSQTSIG